MRTRFAALTISALAGCANAPIERTGPDEYAIGTVTKDAIRSDVSLRSQHERRASQQCGAQGGWSVNIEPATPDGRYHFKCVMPAPTPPPPQPVYATESELNAARTAWRDCMELAEPPVDDMLSDANTVATVLATRCESEFGELLDLSRKGYTWQAPASAFQSVRHTVALDVVLRVRAKQRKPSAPPPPVVIPKLVPPNR